MQQSTQQTQKETLSTQNNAEKTPKQNSSEAKEITEIMQKMQLVESEPIEGTPFRLTKEQDKWYITFGNYKVTTGHEIKNYVLDQLETEKWMIMMHMTIIIVDKNMRWYNIEERQEWNKKHLEENNNSEAQSKNDPR